MNNLQRKELIDKFIQPALTKELVKVETFIKSFNLDLEIVKLGKEYTFITHEKTIEKGIFRSKEVVIEKIERCFTRFDKFEVDNRVFELCDDGWRKKFFFIDPGIGRICSMFYKIKPEINRKGGKAVCFIQLDNEIRLQLKYDKDLRFLIPTIPDNLY